MYRCVRIMTPSIVLLLVIFICGVNAKYKDYEDALKSPYYKEAWNLLSPEKMLMDHYKYLMVYADDEAGKNSTCRRDMETVKNATIANEAWALQMTDASSKVPSGLLKGNMIDLGQYDECMAVRSNSTTHVIRGRHCMYSITLAKDNKTLPIKPTLSVCLPASCSAENIEEYFEKIIEFIKLSQGIDIKIVSPTCSPIDPVVWDSEFIVCFVILIIFVIFLVACTVIEVLCRHLDTGHYRSPVLGTLAMFSLRKSASSIFNMEIRKGNLPAIHGIRFLSMAWVVLGHEFILTPSGATVNTLDFMDWIQSWKSLYIFIAPFTVDTFFAITGFLMTYLFLKQMPKQKKFNLPMYYLHRFFRLTPSVIALLVFTIVFVPKLGSGARWDSSLNGYVGNCRENWWPTILYIQNFVKKEKMCLGHLWYLAVDMQLFWISPVILYPLYRKPKFGLMILAALFLTSIVVPASVIGARKLPVFSFVNAMMTNPKTIADLFEDIYEKPYHRAGPWLVGIFLGYEVAMHDRRLNRWTVAVGWLTAIASFAFCTFGTRSFMDPDYEYDVVWETFFSAVSRPIWAVGVCWIIYASIKNCAGPLSSILSSRIFLPLSRLSYCVYLVHMVIQTMNNAAQRTPEYFSDYYSWRSFFSTLTIAVMVAFVFSILFESPMMALEKLLFHRKPQSKSDSQKELRTNEVEISKEEK